MKKSRNYFFIEKHENLIRVRKDALVIDSEILMRSVQEEK